MMLRSRSEQVVVRRLNEGLCPWRTILQGMRDGSMRYEQNLVFFLPHYRLMMIPRAMAMSSLTKSRMVPEVDFCLLLSFQTSFRAYIYILHWAVY